MAKPAVSTGRCPRRVCLETSRQKPRRKTVLGELGERPRGPRQRLQGSMEHVEHQEADDRRFGEAPENGRQRR